MKDAPELIIAGFGWRFAEKWDVGLHLLDANAEIGGLATLDDQSREFRSSVVCASVPIPNVGTWYRYSPTRCCGFLPTGDAAVRTRAFVLERFTNAEIELGAVVANGNISRKTDAVLLGDYVAGTYTGRG